MALPNLSPEVISPVQSIWQLGDLTEVQLCGLAWRQSPKKHLSFNPRSYSNIECLHILTSATWLAATDRDPPATCQLLCPDQMSKSIRQAEWAWR